MLLCYPDLLLRCLTVTVKVQRITQKGQNFSLSWNFSPQWLCFGVWIRGSLLLNLPHFPQSSPHFLVSYDFLNSSPSFTLTLSRSAFFSSQPLAQIFPPWNQQEVRETQTLGSKVGEETKRPPPRAASQESNTLKNKPLYKNGLCYCVPEMSVSFLGLAKTSFNYPSW